MSAWDNSNPPVVWHGTPEEIRRLTAAVGAHCTCTARPSGHVAICSAHAMLVDQRVLDHLLYVYRTKARFERAEFTDDAGTQGGGGPTDRSGGPGGRRALLCWVG